ncbi:hypothetical protein B0H67DRAFT_684397 [Lasiosphaeris hirsuta]|uniref:Uncharacterized protein n=1 Tax=Lasiosphaeris hirsuta TaxID=260670 RepID=A0AA40A7E4_9PEZI|nr:hypothetical protein B0H67DRAFT_684397 [Lasiosphaeris hirsuta]
MPGFAISGSDPLIPTANGIQSTELSRLFRRQLGTGGSRDDGQENVGKLCESSYYSVMPFASNPIGFNLPGEAIDVTLSLQAANRYLSKVIEDRDVKVKENKDNSDETRRVREALAKVTAECDNSQKSLTGAVKNYETSQKSLAENSLTKALEDNKIADRALTKMTEKYTASQNSLSAMTTNLEASQQSLARVTTALKRYREVLDRHKKA